MLKFNDSAQDGYDKIGRYYKVRYQYAEGRSSSNTRDFCEDMMSASARGIVYTKEAILDMEYERVNAGWGAGGSDYYSIWLYKGGGNCGHYWRRKIYRYNMVEDGIENASIEDADQVVSTTEAISDGFRPESNDQKVSRIPRNMTNNGFIN